MVISGCFWLFWASKYNQQTSIGDISCIVENITFEPRMLHVALRPIKKETFPNTYSEGFVYVGKEKLKDKILSKKLK